MAARSSGAPASIRAARRRSPPTCSGWLVAALVLGVAGNQLSRQVEASADTFALQLTHDPQALIQVQRRLALSSVADPDPPGIVTALIGTHPSTVDRIGAAVAYERGAR